MVYSPKHVQIFYRKCWYCTNDLLFFVILTPTHIYVILWLLLLISKLCDWRQTKIQKGGLCK